QHSLIKAITKFHQIDPSMITLGNGSNDVLDLIARVFLKEAVETVVSQYAFIIYKLVAQAVGATIIEAPAKDFGHDLHAMLRAITPQTKVIWIANPNNPTGTFMPYAEVQTFIAQVPRDVIVV